MGRVAKTNGKKTGATPRATAVVATRVVSATEFKAKCLSILDDIAQQGQRITVTRRGVAVATIGPVKKAPWKSPIGSWVGRGKIVGDIVSPIVDLWDMTKRKGA